MEYSYWVYILSNRRNTVLYIGVTNNLARRVNQHKQKTQPGFTSKYNISKLVYFECTDDIAVALHREKQLKKWRRAWKNELIETLNPNWQDLYPTIL